jgi:oligoendopeptidase F
MSKPEFPRQYVRPGETLSEWSRIEPYFEQLRSAQIETAQQLNEWLLDCSELAACIDEVGTDRYVKMTCQTDAEERKQAYLDFVENIEPKCKPVWHGLDTKYASTPCAKELPRERFEIFDRSVTNRVKLFREENISLQVEEAKLEQRYQEVTGAMTVEYDGKEHTLQQLSVYLERTDRAVREEVWKLSTSRRLEDADTLDEIFDGLFKLRHQIATNADLPDYRTFAFRSKERFDYTPEDCVAFHDAVEKACVPLMRAGQTERKRKLGVDTLRPWDLGVDVKGRSPLKPFASADDLVAKCSRVFDRLDPELGEQFRQMSERGELDLVSRKGKAPGGYQSTYHETRRPFIFMNAVGLQRDVRTLIHEAGHAFHAVACRHDPLVHYRSAPIEFAEVASMGMELLTYDLLDEFFSGEDLDRAKRQQLEGVVNVLPWVATIDAFQHWMYTHPDHDHDQRREQWLGLLNRFGGIEDYAGFDSFRDRSWQRQLHLFQVPFYYIEYGIAQLGALQVWRNFKDDPAKALADYRHALSLGGSRTLPKLFDAAGIRFDFTIDTLGPLMETVQAEMEKLSD